MRSMVKCLVWDLDDTLWDGVVVEGDDPVPFPPAVAALHALDRRGVLHAVASRGSRGPPRPTWRARAGRLFIVVEVGWGAKSDAVRRIAEALDIGLDAVAFIDNDPLERAEVTAAHPAVRCYPASRAGELAELAEFTQPGVTAEAGRRRQLYRMERAHKASELEHGGPSSDFLASLGLVMTVRQAREDDLARAHELTVRTNQLNTTGWTADLPELRRRCADPDQEVLVAELADRFGPYGVIGLALSEITEEASVLKLLLMSCRVMSRGVGSALLGHVVGRAMAAGRRPMAEFVPTDVNRIMLVTLRFSGFRVTGGTPERVVLSYDGDQPPAIPAHVDLVH
ncbi:hypothetical protein K7G98_06425 [Saccharothrix sp. MB29]|nr:hypothetical protein [Saccharothrix sp. MB29]